MEDAIDGNGIEGGNEGFLSPSSSLSPPPPVVSGSDSEADSDASGGKEENENEDEDEDEDEEEEEVKECSTAEDETRNPEFGEEVYCVFYMTASPLQPPPPAQTSMSMTNHSFSHGKSRPNSSTATPMTCKSPSVSRTTICN